MSYDCTIVPVLPLKAKAVNRRMTLSCVIIVQIQKNVSGSNIALFTGTKSTPLQPGIKHWEIHVLLKYILKFDGVLHL